MKYSEQLRDQLSAVSKLPDYWDAAHKKAQKRRDEEDIKDYNKILKILNNEKITPKILVALYASPNLFTIFGQIIFLEDLSFGGNNYFYFKREDIYINAIIIKDSRHEKIVEERYQLVRKMIETKIVFKAIDTE